MNEAASTFDPDLFQNISQEAEFSTEYVPIPENEYTGMIMKVEARQFTDGESGKVSTVMGITWRLSAEGVDDADGKLVDQGVFLELNEADQLETGKGKNVPLGRLLEAINLNGKPWSPSGLVGNIATVNVEQYPGKDKHEGRIFNRVKKVTTL